MDHQRQIPPEPLTIPVGVAAMLLGISRSHAYELCASDQLPCIHLGRRVFVLRLPLLALLAATPPADAAVNPSSHDTDLPLPQSGSGGNHNGASPWGRR